MRSLVVRTLLAPPRPRARAPVLPPTVPDSALECLAASKELLLEDEVEDALDSLLDDSAASATAAAGPAVGAIAAGSTACDAADSLRCFAAPRPRALATLGAGIALGLLGLLDPLLRELLLLAVASCPPGALVAGAWARGRFDVTSGALAGLAAEAAGVPRVASGWACCAPRGFAAVSSAAGFAACAATSCAVGGAAATEDCTSTGKGSTGQDGGPSASHRRRASKASSSRTPFESRKRSCCCHSPPRTAGCTRKVAAIWTRASRGVGATAASSSGLPCGSTCGDAGLELPLSVVPPCAPPPGGTARAFSGPLAPILTTSAA
mmetsp:Transcript_96150/g.310453  ORF Transcript_96150/g.310453 Transcript_96150/m.310453 type:complete len:322 (+) Transcript_96150:1072-2037(+)